MAIQKSIVLKNGITVANAYHKVSSVNLVKSTINRVIVEVSVFRDVESRTANMPPVDRFSFIVQNADFNTYFSINTLSTSDPFKQVYLYIKTQKNLNGNDYTTDVVDV
jgi:hypothetical protein